MYQSAVSKGHTASLVQHSENDLFLWRVGGIPGGCTVTVTTTFVGPVVMSKKFGTKPQTEIKLHQPNRIREHPNKCAALYTASTTAGRQRACT